MNDYHTCMGNNTSGKYGKDHLVHMPSCELYEFDCKIHKMDDDEYFDCWGCIKEQIISEYNSDINNVLMGIIDLCVHRPLFTQEVRKEWYFEEFDKLIKQAIKLTKYETPGEE